MNILIFENNDDDFNHLTSCIKNYFTKENIDYHIHRCKNKEELLKTIKEQTGSAIVQKNEERYSFVEIKN